MSAITTQKKIQLAVSKLGHRLFRLNTAMGWAGKIIRISKPVRVELLPGDIVIKNAYPLHAGLCIGGSDLIGYTNKGRFLAVEIKDGNDRPTKEQLNFIDAVNNSGGIAFIAHTNEEAIEKINLAISNKKC